MMIPVVRQCCSAVRALIRIENNVFFSLVNCWLVFPLLLFNFFLLSCTIEYWTYSTWMALFSELSCRGRFVRRLLFDMLDIVFALTFRKICLDQI